MNYSITKSQDKYYLENTGIVELTYTIETVSNCSTFTTITTGTVAMGAKVELDYFSKDGEYKITLEAGGEKKSVHIHYYEDLLKSIITNTYAIICNCECGCNTCTEPLEDKVCSTLSLHAELNAFKRLIYPEGEGFHQYVYEQTKCLINNPVFCTVKEEILFGESKCNQDLAKQLIALDYLGIYFSEYFGASTEDKTYIDTKFNTEKILCCVENLGIKVKDIKNLINENMGNFTINIAEYVNQPPSQVGNYNINIDNRTNLLITLAMFTTDTTPAYSDPENDPVDAVKITSLPAEGILTLNGIAVTVNQIISAADINSNLLFYEAPNQDAADTVNFSFQVRDTGSMTWVN